MKKILSILFLFTLSLFGTSFGVIPGSNSDGSTSGNSGVTNGSYLSNVLRCTSNCSEWQLNLYNPSNTTKPYYLAMRDASYIGKNITLEQFVTAGLAYFKYNADNSNALDYPIFIVLKKVETAKNDIKQTIQKVGNDFVYKENLSELSTISLDTENVGTSFFLGQVDVNYGMASAMAIRKTIKKIEGVNYIAIELERVNFASLIKERFNEFCKYNPEKSFSFMYDPNSTLQLAKVLEKSPTSLTPNQYNQYEYGLINFPCTYTNSSGKLVNNTFAFLKLGINLSNKPYDTTTSRFVNFYSRNSNSWDGSINTEFQYLFQDNGFVINLPTHDKEAIFRIATSFFTSFMEHRQIEYGIIVKDTPVDIVTKDWSESKKCSWKRKKKVYYHKKTMSWESEYYTLSPLTHEMPFSESDTNFAILPALSINSYAPVNMFPSNKESIYYITPDKHIQTHVLSTGNALVNNSTSLIGKNIGAISSTASKDTKCGFSWLLVILLIIIIVVISIFVPPMAGIFANFITFGAWGIGLGEVLGLAAIIYAISLIGNPSLSVNAASIDYTLNTDFSLKMAQNTGSGIYQNFATIKTVIENVSTPSYLIQSKYFNEIKGTDTSKSGFSFQIRDDVVATYLDIVHLPRGKDTALYDSYNHITHITKLHSTPNTLGNPFYTWNSSSNWSGGGYISRSISQAFSQSSMGGGSVNIKQLRYQLLFQMIGIYDTNSFDVYNTRAIFSMLLENFLPTYINDIN